MSDSDEPTMSVQESEPSEQESNSQQGEMAKNIKKRTLDADEDEDSKNQSSKLENLKKMAKKPTARRIEFEQTEEEEALKEKDDALHLACSICREPFLDPVVTRCKHYFCKRCALKHHEKNNNCFVCDKPTLGVFNAAVEIKEKIAKVREKVQAMVKEVSTTVEKAVVLVKNAEAMSAESARVVEEVETMVGIVEAYGPMSAADEDPSSWDSLIRLMEYVEAVAASARKIAEKAAEMMQEANAKTETATAEMGKTLMVLKNVKWNV